MFIKAALVNDGEIEFSRLNIIVGSNNTGKSTLLRELYETACTAIKKSGNNKWIEETTLFIDGVRDRLDNLFEHPDRFRQVNNLNPDETLGLLHLKTAKSLDRWGGNLFGSSFYSIGTSSLYSNNGDVEITIEPMSDPSSISDTPEYIIRQLTDIMTTICIEAEFCDSRLAETFETCIEDVAQTEQTPTDKTSQLFCDRQLLDRINSTFEKVFGVRLGFDNIRQASAPLRIMPTIEPPLSFSTEVEKAHWWEAHSSVVAKQGDGIKAFLKLLLTLLDDSASIIFIDEPETFLHPPQRRAMGEAIASAANAGKQIFIATHDADIIRGALTVCPDPNVLNLGFSGSERDVRRIDLITMTGLAEGSKEQSKHGVQMMNERVISSLFYEKTLLVENENDRVVYEHYCQQHLYTQFQGRCFIGFNGSGTALKLFDLMSDAAMRVGCIIDIDFLFSQSERSTRVNRLNPLLCQRHSDFAQMVNAKSNAPDVKKHLKEKGLSALPDEERTQAEMLIADYASYSIFVVPAGELESWFSDTGAIGKNRINGMISMSSRMEIPGLSKFLGKALE